LKLRLRFSAPLSALAVFVAFAAACSSSSSSPTSAPPSSADDGGGMGDGGGGDDGGPVRGAYDPVPFGGSARPVQVYVPSGYKDGTPTPLLVLLHGYSANGVQQDFYLGMRQVAESRTLLYAHPDGTVDSKGNHYWNATDACCNFDHTTVDDASYLAALVAEIGTRYAVDPKRVYFFGHSNGAFMSYRMACDHAEIVAGIVSLAGAMWSDPSKCKPSVPVTVLEVHGTADQVIAYGGGTTGASGGTFPSAATTVADWVKLDECASTADTSAPPVDLDASIAGAETTITRYRTGCKSGTEVDLWSIQGGSHVPGFNATFSPMAVDYLLAHPKP
jgi:polyhydroxybutyrate depolymerase